MKHFIGFIVGVLLLGGFAGGALAQAPVYQQAVALRSPEQLDQLLGPIALYPDPLVAQILPAATLPSQIVMVERGLQQGLRPEQIDAQTWEPSVKALARSPDLLLWMDTNLGWTTEVGQAFLAQQVDVMNSIQRLRGQALALGNLQSTPQQTVVNTGGYIEILPANPQIIYVPVYQPSVVYVQRPPRPGVFVSFGIGLGVGGWLNHDLDWHDHQILVWQHDAPRPSDWWNRRPEQRGHVTVVNNNTTIINNRNERISNVGVWRPHDAPAGRVENRADRGWDNQPRAAVTRPVAPPRQVISQGPTAGRPNGALIGAHSAPETRDYSNRGRTSRQPVVTQEKGARPGQEHDRR
ncbi:MAG: hypothetical protein JWM16_2982 [Verrucomicrobiales bacterium]|nr:hypothetical protein [Verrucomicrobiales bacterium]